MPAYNSTFNSFKAPKETCGMAILPLKTNVKGPAPKADPKDEDIIDEAIKYYRANVLFASFEIKGTADRVLVYLTLFISQCLKRFEKATSKSSGEKIMFDLSKEKFPVPGDRDWPFGGHIPKPKGRSEEEDFRAYVKQLREETCARMLEVVYRHSSEAPDKFWMGFSKRKFMGILTR